MALFHQTHNEKIPIMLFINLHFIQQFLKMIMHVTLWGVKYIRCFFVFFLKQISKIKWPKAQGSCGKEHFY